MKEKMIQFVIEIIEKVTLANNKDCKIDFQYLDSRGEYSIHSARRLVFDKFPLTLERILDVLNISREFGIFFYIKNMVHPFIFNGDMSLMIPWIPNKPLEEQSDKTIEKIAKILGYDAK